MKAFFVAFLFVAAFSTSQQQSSDDDRSACECGLPRKTRRIVGGSETGPGQFPWMAGLIMRRNKQLVQFCGGSIIANQWVLSAAHCFAETGIKAAEVLIYMADHDLSSKTEAGLPSIGSTVIKIIVNPGYSSKTQDADVALLKMTNPVTFSEYIRPVCLPEATLTVTGKTATVTGWGRTSEGGPTSMKLRAVQVPILPNSQCQSAYKTSAKVTANMMCAGIPQGGKDSCQGDSGGPLFYQCPSGRDVQCGVVSFGVGCARAGFPGFYANVPKLMPWIAANVEGATLCGTTCT